MKVRIDSIGKFLIIFGVVLLTFGSFNLITNSYGQNGEEEKNSNSEPTFTDRIIERLITEVMPILGGILSIGFSFLRKRGVQISAEAEKDFTNIALSVVQRQSKWIYEQLRDNPNYQKQLGKGRIPPQLGKEAKEKVMYVLGDLLEDKRFTRATKSVIQQNLPELVERLVTKNNLTISERCLTLIEKLAPMTVDGILLNYKSKDDAQHDIDNIIKESIGAIKQYFNTEEIVFQEQSIDIHVKAHLNKKIGNVS